MKPHAYQPQTMRDGSSACADCYAPPSHPVHTKARTHGGGPLSGLRFAELLERLHNVIARQKAEIERLRAALGRLPGENDQLMADKDWLRTELKQLRAEIEGLRAEIEGLKGDDLQ